MEDVPDMIDRMLVRGGAGGIIGPTIRGAAADRYQDAEGHNHDDDDPGCERTNDCLHAYTERILTLIDTQLG